MKWFHIEFEEDYDYPDDPEIINSYETTDDDDADDGMFVFVVCAENVTAAINKALIEYRDSAAIERDIDEPSAHLDD